MKINNVKQKALRQGPSYKLIGWELRSIPASRHHKLAERRFCNPNRGVRRIPVQKMKGRFFCLLSGYDQDPKENTVCAQPDIAQGSYSPCITCELYVVPWDYARGRMIARCSRSLTQWKHALWAWDHRRPHLSGGLTARCLRFLRGSAFGDPVHPWRPLPVNLTLTPGSIIRVRGGSIRNRNCSA
jgi:hypothetical protein